LTLIAGSSEKFVVNLTGFSSSKDTQYNFMQSSF
jgi:hypothetical protein